MSRASDSDSLFHFHFALIFFILPTLTSISHQHTHKLRLRVSTWDLGLCWGRHSPICVDSIWNWCDNEWVPTAHGFSIIGSHVGAIIGKCVGRGVSFIVVLSVIVYALGSSRLSDLSKVFIIFLANKGIKPNSQVSSLRLTLEPAVIF